VVATSQQQGYPNAKKQAAESSEFGTERFETFPYRISEYFGHEVKDKETCI